MNLPDHLMILGLRYEIEMVDGTEDDEYGHCDYDNCRIRIRRSQCHQQMADTILHEATHAIDHRMNNGMTENAVHRVASGMLALLRENPALVAFVTANDAPILSEGK